MKVTFFLSFRFKGTLVCFHKCANETKCFMIIEEVNSFLNPFLKIETVQPCVFVLLTYLLTYSQVSLFIHGIFSDTIYS